MCSTSGVMPASSSDPTREPLTASMSVMKPAAAALPVVAPITAPLPPSRLDELRRWRMAAELRYVGKSLRSATPAPKAPGKPASATATPSIWDTYIRRLALRTGRPVAEVDSEEAQRILAKLDADRKIRMGSR